MKTVLLLLLLALFPQRSVSFLPFIIGNDAVATRRRRIAFYPREQQQRIIDDVPSLVSLSVSASSRSTQQQQPQEEAEEEDIEFDEDEFLKDTGKLNLSYDNYLARMQHFAQTTSTDPTAVPQAHALFDEMLQAYLVTQDAGLWPNTDIYNLLMETHAYSSDPDGANKVDEILSRMEEDKSVTNSTPQPNLESYAKLMEAWARRREIQKVEAVVGDRLTKNNSDDLQPDTYIYNKLIRSYGMVGQADQARRVLDDILLHGYLEKNDDEESSSLLLRPNAKTWTHVLRAYAAAAGNAQRKRARQRQQKQQVDEEDHYLETIQDLMRQMAQYARRNDEEDWKPGVDAYNALLQCLSFYTQSRQQQLRTSSSSSSSSSEVVVSASKEAESVLYGMIEQYRENGDESMKPTDESFFHVMNAYRGESNAGVAIKVEKLLELQRALASTSSSGSEAGGGRLEPSTRTCNAAIAAMSRTRDPQKAVRAQRLVQRMQNNDGDNDNSSSNKQYACKPNLTTYRNLLNTCAYSGAEANTSPEERLAAFQIAVETLNQIRQQYPHDEVQQNRQKSQPQPQQLDSGIYSLFLRACANLMPSNRKRDAVVESVFSKCCKDGLVNDAILRDFERTASEELQVSSWW